MGKWYKKVLIWGMIFCLLTGGIVLGTSTILKSLDKEEVGDQGNNHPGEGDSFPSQKPPTPVEPLEPEPIVNKKVVFLTFDDSPTSKITPQILEILKEYGVKATFFVIGNLAEKRPDIVQRINNEGHLVGNHTYSHDYKHIYANVKNLMDELDKTQRILEDILGQALPKIMRFPGGMTGEKYMPFYSAVEREGYIYFKWNVVNGDGEGKNYTSSEMVQRVRDTNQGFNKAVVLMHDSATKQTTVEALPGIIEYFISNGYVFDTLDNY